MTISELGVLMGPPARRVLLTALGLGLGAIAAMSLAIIEWGAWVLVRPSRRVGAGGAEPAPWQPVEAFAPDGTRLAGAFRAAPAARKRTVLLLHGFGEDRSALLGRGDVLAAAGWNVALLDARGRGQSGGHWVTFGGREAGDVGAWIDALTAEIGPDATIAVWGRSMGAAIAQRAAAADGRIAGLVLEAPYPELEATIAAWLRRASLPRLFARSILRRAGRLAGVALDEPAPIELAASLRVPVLIMLGTDDPVVSPDAVLRLAHAFREPAEVVEVAGARHGDVFEIGGKALAATILAFLDRVAHARRG